MRYCKFLCGLIVSFSIFISNPVFASAEQIDNFDVTIKVNADASIEVTEKIDYDFGNLQKHGIYRDIPVKYASRGGNYNLRLSDISIWDKDGNPYNFDISASSEDRKIKIGDADIFVSGKKTYVINYKVKRAINYFSDHDELYWNVTGNGWNVPITNASARIIFPQNLKREDVQLACYSGNAGSKNSCSLAQYTSSDDSALAGGAEFAESNLSPHQGLTIVTGIPIGVLQKPTFAASLADIITDNLILLLPLLVFAIMFYLWWIKGRDPQGRGTVIPEFDVPDNLSPAEVGTIMDEKCGQKEIVAEIINLAVKGYIKIRREEKEVLFVKSTDYVFTRFKLGSDLDNGGIVIMNGLFKGKGDTAKLSELKNSFYKEYDLAKTRIYQSVVAKGYFSESSDVTRIKYSAIPLCLSGGLLYDLIKYGFSWTTTSFLLCALIALTFAQVMPRKTKQGVLAKEHILGLKDYLVTAEKDRLEFHNAPDKNPQQFEKLLPYAIALGVEKEWAKQFEGIYNTNPAWYKDSRGFNNFSAVYFVSDLGNFKTSFASTAASAPLGGSGLGGGGFSGGGFGGGGGGSW